MVMIGSRNTTLELLAPFLSMEGRFGRPVVDRTGLEGRWDFTLEWLPEPKGGAAPDPDAQGPSFLEAMHEELGLRIDTAKAMVAVLVVDHVERPAENQAVVRPMNVSGLQPSDCRVVRTQPCGLGCYVADLRS